MRALFVTSATNETIKYGESFACLPGNSIESCRYTERFKTKKGVVEQGRMDEEVYAHALRYQPDLIVYIGSRWGELPSMGTLGSMNKNVAPVVHLCSDAADHPWHDLLLDYAKAKCFALQVAIDGNKDWPLHNDPNGLTALTPFDPRRYPDPKPHAERDIHFGYSGSIGSAGNPRKKRSPSIRYRIVDECRRDGGMQIREREDHNVGLEDRTYQAYVDYLGRCRVTLNVPFSGTQAAMQVKGRVVEAGLAGCVLLEHRGAPTAYWFTPGVDYLEYDNAGHANQLAAALKPDESQAMAMRLRARVLAEHGPEAFWSRVLKRIGLKPFGSTEQIGLAA